ncbi:MAG: hypothetical protein J5507_00675 [Clostridia bacterium]|nr:hypothetical protein [Clostridia bacterium]
MKKNLFFIKLVFILFIIFLFLFSNYSFGAYPKLVSKLVNGFEQIKTWLIKIATPAAAVAVRQRNFYEKV